MEKGKTDLQPSLKMKSKSLLFSVLAISFTWNGYSQQVLTLKECYDKAQATSALASEKKAYSDISALRDKNLAKGWLPSLDANGNFIYNSSVVDLSSALGSIPVPGIADAIKPLPHEQYKVTLDINQMIYDGGTIKSAREIEKADLSINEKQTELDLYKIKGQVNGYFFSVLLLDRQKEQLGNYLGVIEKRISALESALKNGVALKSDLDVLTSEKIKLDQQLGEIGIKRASLVNILSGLIGGTIDPSATLMLPSVPEQLPGELSRPELQLFDLRKQQLEAGRKAIESRRMPKVFGFATFGYGNPPGNNFFKDQFAPYYILGAGIKWNIFDWNKSGNDREIISYQQNIIDKRKADLSDNLKRLLDAKEADIKSLTEILLSDNDLIAIRKRITAAAQSQYENGTITATDYMNELNSEKQAVINNEIHKINLVMAKVEYMNISGQEMP